jgi:hypothetical protein
MCILTVHENALAVYRHVIAIEIAVGVLYLENTVCREVKLGQEFLEV